MIIISRLLFRKRFHLHQQTRDGDPRQTALSLRLLAGIQTTATRTSSGRILRDAGRRAPSAGTIGSGSGESMVVLGYLYGSSGQTICTATASSGSSATCSGYSDNAEAATLPEFLTGEAAGPQWQNSNGTSQSSGSITSGANACHCIVLCSNSRILTKPRPMDRGRQIGIPPLSRHNGNLLGVSSQTICTISPSSGTTTTAGCTGYADYDQPVSEPSTGSGVRRIFSGNFMVLELDRYHCGKYAHWHVLQTARQHVPSNCKSTVHIRYLDETGS